MRHFSIVFTLCLALTHFNISAQNERILLIESFTNSDCENCAHQIPELNALIASNSDRVAAIQYHVNWPSDSDPMYTSNPTANNARTEYYGVTGVPHVIVDGNHFSGTPNQLSQSIIDFLLAIESPIKMQLDIEVNESANTVSAHVKGQSAIDISNLRLFVGIIEKEVRFNSAPGSNGECIFYNVMNNLLPNTLGQTIEYLAADEAFDYSFTSDLNNIYDLEQLNAIAWVQISNGSKSVLQACLAKGPHGLSETDHETPLIYPNPTTGMVSITSPTPQKLSVFNPLGQCVFKGYCNNTLHLNLRDFGTGLFVIKVGSHFQKINVF